MRNSFLLIFIFSIFIWLKEISGYLTVFRKMAILRKGGKKKTIKKKPVKGKSTTRRLDGIVPGVGQGPPSAFGSNGKSQSGVSYGKNMSLACWDGLSPVHLPLPRAIGPYTVIRLTRTFSTNDSLVIIGTFQNFSTASPSNVDYGGNAWSQVCAIGFGPNDMARSINPGGGSASAAPQARMDAWAYDTLGGMDSAQVTPSAITVQVMNTHALQSTSGLMYAGVVKTLMKEKDQDITPETLGQDFITTQSPRLLSLPKLSLRGVKGQSLPMNMNRLSDFQTFSADQKKDGTTIYSDFAWGKINDGSASKPTNSLNVEPCGFAPICFFRPEHGPETLTYQITTEFRCRFDLRNVASSTHRHHPVATEGVWNRLMGLASSAGHGIIDIADSAAVRGAVTNAATAAAMSML